jgi:pimeloyl-ACP methyl ester carboxylesterase
MTVAEKTTSADGTEIAFEQVGDGPPLIIVGGAWNDRRSPADLAELLAPSFSVYTYDRRGRGDSGDTPPYAPEREVEDLEAVIEAAGGSAYLYGHSSGAELARRTTARGVSVTRLAMYEPPYIVDGSRAPLPSDYIEHLEELSRQDKGREIFEYFMTKAVGMPEEMVKPMLDSPMVEQMTRIAHTVSYDGHVMGSTQEGNPLPAEWRDSVTAPTLVMVGGNSPEWMQSGCQALVRVLPDVSYRRLEGQDHAVAPVAIAPVLEDFFA